MNMRHIITLTILALTFLSSEIHADILRSSMANQYNSNSDTQAYIGAAFGKVSHDIDTFEEPNSIELLVGIEVNDNLAIEASYLNPGDAGDNTPPEWTIAVDGFSFGAVGKHKVSPELELQAKAGLLFWDLAISEDGFGTFYENDGTDFFFGFGAMFKVSEKVSLGMRYSFYEVEIGTETEDFDILQAQLQIAID